MKSPRERVCEALDRLAKEHGQETFVSDGYGYYEDAQHEFIPMVRQGDKYRETLEAIVLHGQHPTHDSVWAAYALDLANAALQSVQDPKE